MSGEENFELETGSVNNSFAVSLLTTPLWVIKG